jgi:N utilization substance protein A
MNTELKEAIEALEKEKNIMRETLFEAIENALLTACKSNYGRVDNIKAWVDRDTFEYYCTAEKEVVETKDDVEDKLTQIALEDAVKINPAVRPGDKVEVKINSQSFGRIATQIAKNVILQKIREEERSAIYDYYIKMQKNIVTGIVQRINGGNISVNLGRAEGLLNEKETVPGEHLKPTDRIKVYIIDVRTTNRGPRILVSRTHPELVKKLFEQEVAEIQDKVVEIKSIAREAGSRTKIAVFSTDESVDPVGACIGAKGQRIAHVCDELKGEKVDIIRYSEDPETYIAQALAPADIISVAADVDSRTCSVVVSDDQLSLAIGKEGQNARLAAKLTGYKIDIKPLSKV